MWPVSGRGLRYISLLEWEGEAESSAWYERNLTELMWNQQCDLTSSLVLSGESCRCRNPQGLRSDLGRCGREETDQSGGSLGTCRSVIPSWVLSAFSKQGESPNRKELDHNIQRILYFVSPNTCYCHIKKQHMESLTAAVKYEPLCPRCPGVEWRAAVVGESGPSDPPAGRQNPPYRREEAARSQTRSVRSQVVSWPPAPGVWRQR